MLHFLAVNLNHYSMQDDEVLCNYQKGEERGVTLLRQLKTFAPEEVTEEIAAQIIDELKHDRLFSGRLKDLDIDCFGMNHSLEAVYDLAQECVDRKDWIQSITIQTVIEELAMATFTDHLQELDPATQEVLREIIHDEARHLAFGVRELSKIAKGNEAKIKQIHLRVLEIFIATLKDKRFTKDQIGRMNKTVVKAYTMHKTRLSRIGIKIPTVKEALFTHH